MAASILSFGVLLGYLQTVIGELVDPRKSSNATCYSLKDIVLGAFSAFFMQSESFLDYQRQLNSRHGRNNAQSLFGLARIPSIEQMRKVLDGVNAEALSKVFEWVYRALKEQGYLKAYETLDGNLLMALDGTEYYSSQKLSCPCCSSRTSKSGKVTYYHQALLPVIVTSHQSAVISLPPAFITPQDGSQKQDCEQTAAKRWLRQYASLFEGQAITLLGDDLYSHQPMCEECLAQGYNFIFGCLPESHAVLYDWVEFMAAKGQVKTFEQRQENGREFERWHYRYLSDVPLRASEPVLSVNWFELTVTRERDGHQVYHNSWITNHELTPQRVIALAAGGRGRWKTENENHNVLKTQGYHLEHNFGHGQRYLAKVLLILNLLAFLFHTVLGFVDERYQRVRQQRGTRKGFFQDILALTKYLLFESWQALLDFMWDDAGPKGKKTKRTKTNTS